MDYNFESSLDDLDDETLKYVGVTHIDFKTHLSPKELVEVQDIIFSINTLIQITFKDGTEVSDIENIKHLIELSPICDDKKIEKLILRRNSVQDIKKILAMPYENPDTWHIAYEINKDNYTLTTLPNYRILEEYIDIVLSCVKQDMSPLEKIKEVYDFIKLLELDKDGSSHIPDIVKKRRTNNLGFSLLFSKILERLGIKSFIGKIERDGKTEYISIISIEDEKYDASGIYAFDPASDSLPKNVYKSDAIRKISYNFFGLRLEEMQNTKENDKLMGTLSLLVSDSFDFSKRKIIPKEKEKLESIFNITLDILFDRIKKTKKIKDEKLVELFLSTIHKEDFLGLNRNIEELLKNNYYLRKKEIFNEEEKREEINIHDV